MKYEKWMIGTPQQQDVDLLRSAGYPYLLSTVLAARGITTPEDAARLRGTTLYAHREQIPVTPGAMLQEDLIGLPVFDADTRRSLGTVLRIDPSPAANLLVVAAPEGEVLVPLIPPFVKELSDHGVYLTPPAGMFREGGPDEV